MVHVLPSYCGHTCAFTWAQLPPEDIIATSGGSFGCHSWGVVLLASYIEARDAAKPETHRLAPTARVCSALC